MGCHFLRNGRCFRLLIFVAQTIAHRICLEVKIILILQGLPTCLYGAIFCKEVVSSINIFLIIH